MPEQNVTLQAAKADNDSLIAEAFYMWGFVKNTRRMMEDLSDMRPGTERDEMLGDIKGRSCFAAILFDDQTGKLEMMTGNGGEEFSQAVKEKSKKAQGSAFAIRL
ncbi:hypothetical protein H2199_005311 [Coniosporium tulheliwenetii]|uniref:Uncharacterized protein n=1 Tax=Coniosporium tulheliwenetii TaxID=3383036 RepID=A0ACC2Z1A6_9PEZI|nr:hypothetical protein H2199_005311 [Cladosporium sp. JES 115]